MIDEPSVTVPNPPKGRLSEATLETSRLLLEFLHTAYATRRVDTDQPGQGIGTGEGSAGVQSAAAEPVSSHAIRAAIYIHKHRERTVGQLASGLGISYGWASRVVEELEGVGYVIRERDPDDRRVVRVRLNPERLGDVERAYHWRGEVVAEALEPLSESERIAVRAFLRRLTELLRGGQPGHP